MKQLNSATEVSAFIAATPNALVMYSATWCGPCKAVKPQIDALIASTWAAFPTEYAFVYEDAEGDITGPHNITAFPTFVLFTAGKEAGRVKGGNIAEIEAMLAKIQASFGGEAHTMGGAALSPEEARQKRLDAMSSKAAAASPTPMDVGAPSAVAAQLVDEMGFDKATAEKGVKHGGGTLEGAIDWITAHQDDEEPSGAMQMVDGGPTSIEGALAQSYKCNDCGKIMSNMANLELHANKTGHSDFAESTEAIKPLTPEEKAAKIAEIKKLLATKRAIREEDEKKAEVANEKQRRNMGKLSGKTKEEMERGEMKRAAQLKKSEKNNAKIERERIRAEIAADKLERQANKGKLKSQLGVDGYNPSAIQYNVDKDMPDAPTDGSDAKPPAAAAAPPAPVQKVSAIPKKHKVVDSRGKYVQAAECINRVAQYRAGGDGGNCLKLLGVFIGNVCDNKDEMKYRGVSLESKAYKGKVKGLNGGRKLLELCGWVQDAEEERLVLNDDTLDFEFLVKTRADLAAALVAYNA